MLRKFLLVVFFTVFTCAGKASFASDNLAQLPGFKTGERILILAPHPDDETLGCAGLIQQALKSGADVRIIYLTNGDHNEFAFFIYAKRPVVIKGDFLHMGRVRQAEARAAMRSLGLDEQKITFLGYPDFGTFAIFSQYWQAKKPFKSLLTRISSVPYKDNFSYGAPYTGESILADLKKLLLAYKPDKIFVTHPADVNGDHRALSLFLEVALTDLAKELTRPEVYAYLIHDWGWPLPRRYHPQIPLMPPEVFLGSESPWYKLELDEEEVRQKHQALLCYRSQTQSSASYLLSFVRKNELFAFLSARGMPLARPLALKENPHLVTYSLEGDYLVIKTENQDGLGQKYDLTVYLFGYNSAIPFPLMPKLRLVTRECYVNVYDQRKEIREMGVIFDTSNRVKIIKIPLKALGDPVFILVSVKFRAEGQLSQAAFQKIEIRKER